MYLFELSIAKPFLYHFTGKFEAPSANWIHEEFTLSDYELFVVTKGILYIYHAKHNYTVTCGECLLLPPVPPPFNIRKGTHPSDCSFYWMHFETNEPVLLKNMNQIDIRFYNQTLPKDKIFIPRQGVIPNQDKIVVLMKQLQDAVKSNYKPAALNYMATVILCELCSQFCTMDQELSKIRKPQKQIYYDIIDFVKQNVNCNLKVNAVASHFGYNEKYLSHLFSSIAGIPLKQFIMTCKIDAANFMLTDTNKYIMEIAAELGFSDSHNFSRTYKKISGLTPTEYRNAFAKRLLYHV